MATEYVEGGGQDQGDFGGGNHGGRVALFCQNGSRVGLLPMVCVETVVVVLVEGVVLVGGG